MMINFTKKILLYFLFSTALSGCQIDYLVKAGYNQALIIKNQKPIDDFLDSNSLNSEQKNKLKLIEKAKIFAERDLGLKKSNNYTTFVNLHRKYVSYIVQVAEPFDLKYHYWHFPIVGDVPYKGFFSEDDAKKEKAIYDQQGYDTYIRGVRAFSTLGWLRDPVLSPMLDYDEDDLVNTIIHETTHATLYIKSNADFNEQLATFVGDKGTELFYEQNEGKNAAIFSKIEEKNDDEKTFSGFIKTELTLLEDWYKQNTGHITKEEKQKHLDGIIERFKKIKFKTHCLDYFSQLKLNNAILLGYKTYVNDLSQFQMVYEKKKNMPAFIEAVKKLEGSKDPAKDLSTL